MAKHITRVLQDLQRYVDEQLEGGVISTKEYDQKLAALNITLEIFEEYESWQEDS